MEREIKFRAWDEANKKMTKSMLLEDLILKASLQNPDAFQWDSEIPMMQYTGLKDKNGQEIWEGDIICWWSSIEIIEDRIVDKRDYHIDTVQFLNGAFCIDDDDDIFLGKWINDKGTDGEVIGNIHQNPELL